MGQNQRRGLGFLCVQSSPFGLTTCKVCTGLPLQAWKPGLLWIKALSRPHRSPSGEAGGWESSDLRFCSWLCSLTRVTLTKSPVFFPFFFLAPGSVLCSQSRNKDSHFIPPEGNQIFKRERLPSPKSHFINKQTKTETQLGSRFPGSSKALRGPSELAVEMCSPPERRSETLWVPVTVRLAGPPGFPLVASMPHSPNITGAWLSPAIPRSTRGSSCPLLRARFHVDLSP